MDHPVFSARTHTYDDDDRNGHDFMTTATSGAMDVPRPGARDHVVWATMTADGPRIVWLRLTGLMGKERPTG